MLRPDRTTRPADVLAGEHGCQSDGRSAATELAVRSEVRHPTVGSAGCAAVAGHGASAEWPTVSIIIPCRNEAHYISPCLESILQSAYPPDRLEVLIADGMSDDGTRDIISRYVAEHRGITLLDNPQRIQAAALNAAIRVATGEMIVRMDVHSTYPPDYVSRLVAALQETGADNVGGLVVTLPAQDTPTSRAIALGLSHRLGVGDSDFRVGTSTRKWVDHVHLGCWRRVLFQRVGLFDEELARGEDVEFNARLITRGGRILLLPDVASRLYARRSLGQLTRMLYQYGYFKPLIARKVGRIMTVRQVVPSVFVLGLLGTGALSLWWPVAAVGFAAITATYAALVLGCAVNAMRRHGVQCGLALLAVFPLMHFGYGIGYLRGLWNHFLRPWKASRPAADVPLTR